jgi:hypothetical protein
MGRIRSTSRWIFSVGGEWSPIAKESGNTRLLREQNTLIREQTRLITHQPPFMPAALYTAMNGDRAGYDSLPASTRSQIISDLVRPGMGKKRRTQFLAQYTALLKGE